MPLRPPTRDAILRYWAGFFGCPAELIDAPGAHVLAHAELEEYRGIFCLRRGPATLVSVPPDQLGQWRARLAPLAADQLTDAAAMAGELGVARPR